MKKIVLAIVLALALLLVVIGCKAQGEHQADEPEETVKVEETQPAETPEPEETTSPVEPMAMTLRKPTQTELFDYFQIAYESGQSITDLGFDDDYILEWELKELHIFFDIDPEFEKPAALDAQYLAWREANHPKEPATEAPSSNTQTKPIQQPQGSGGTQQTSPVANQQGGIDDDFYNSHQGKDPSGGNPVFKPMDDPWDTKYKVDYTGAGGEGTPQPVSGDLGTDVTGGKTPMDFMNVGDDLVEEVRNSGAYVDMSKVGMGD